MASANTNRTIFAIGVTVILGFLAVKLWPAIRRAINQSASGAGGGAGAGGAAGAAYNPYYPQQQSGQGGGLSLGAGSAGGSSSSPFSPLNIIANLVNATSYGNQSPAQQRYINSQLDTELVNVDQAGLPLEPEQLLPLQSWYPTDLYYPGETDSTDTSSYDGGLDTTDYLSELDEAGLDNTVDAEVNYGELGIGGSSEGGGSELDDYDV
jgi:hypothetical protein